MVIISTSGTSNAYITFQSLNKWGAKLVGPSGCGVGFEVRASYIVINNFDISGFDQVSSQGIYLASGSNHIVFGNKIHNIANINTPSPYGNDGIFVQTVNDVIDSNILFAIGRIANSAGTDPDHGMYIDGALGAASTTVKNNLIYDTPFGWAIQLYPGTLNNMLIINNTLDSMNTKVAGAIVQGGNLVNSRIANNLFYNPPGGVAIYASCCGATNSGVTIDHNVTTSGSIIDNSSGTSLNNNITGASTSGLVNNEPGADYILVPGSPAMGAGSSTNAPSLDIVGTRRGSRIDVGAYENPN